MKLNRLVICAAVIVAIAAPRVFAEAIPDVVLTAAKKIAPTANDTDVTTSPVTGFYQLTVGFDIIYISSDGRYVLNGDIIEIDTRTNLKSSALNTKRLDTIDALNENDMVIFDADDKAAPAGTITVFTDITCGYCRKLHQEMNELTAGGVTVRYLAFPRAGVPSDVAADMESIWCADNPQTAMTDAKLGKPVSPKQCDNPVAEHYGLGISMGIRGTPSIFLGNGEMIPGYVPAAELIDRIKNLREDRS